MRVPPVSVPLLLLLLGAAAAAVAAAADAVVVADAAAAGPCRIIEPRCLSDASKPRTLPVAISSTPSDPFHDAMTPEVCAALCAARGLPFCGVEVGVQCFGGKAITNPAGARSRPASDCQTPCSGNRSETCGGDFLIKVFRYSGRCVGPTAPPTPPPLPWQNHSLPFEERLDMLLPLLTVPELVGLLDTGADAVRRLNIPPYTYGRECLAGVAAAGGSSSAFPQPVNMGNTFDVELIRRVGDAISDEARAQYSASQSLTCLAPVLNVCRDPRWGRAYESYGEDPFVVAELGKAMVIGLQEGLPTDPPSKYLKINAAPKHIGVYSVECYGGSGYPHCKAMRQSFDSKVDEVDLHETYLPGWKAAVVGASATGAMCSCECHPRSVRTA